MNRLLELAVGYFHFIKNGRNPDISNNKKNGFIEERRARGVDDPFQLQRSNEVTRSLRGRGRKKVIGAKVTAGHFCWLFVCVDDGRYLSSRPPPASSLPPPGLPFHPSCFLPGSIFRPLQPCFVFIVRTNQGAGERTMTSPPPPTSHPLPTSPPPSNHPLPRAAC